MELALRQNSQPKNVQYFALDDPYSTYIDEFVTFAIHPISFTYCLIPVM